LKQLCSSLWNDKQEAHQWYHLVNVLWQTVENINIFEVKTIWAKNE